MTNKSQLNKRVILDKGSDYANEGELNKLSYYHLEKQLGPLILKLKKEKKCSIADWGGGNSILISYLLSLFKFPRYYNLDYDNSKFTKKPLIKNVKIDFLEKINTKVDYSLSRNVCGYLNRVELSKFLNNVNLNTKKNFLFINWIIDDNYFATAAKIFFELRKENIKIYSHSKSVFIEELENSGFKIKSYNIISVPFNYSKFLKERFKIKESLLKKHKKILKKKRVHLLICWCEKNTKNISKNRWESTYLNDIKSLPWIKSNTPSQFKRIFDDIKPCSVLDVGCGNGDLSCYLAEKEFKVLGIDISKRIISIAKNKKNKKLTFRHVDLFTYKSKNKYDLIVDSGMFHNLKPFQRGAYMKKIISLLNPKGSVIIQSFYKKHNKFKGKSYYFNKKLKIKSYGFDKKDINDLFSPYFDIDFIKIITDQNPINKKILVKLTKK